MVWYKDSGFVLSTKNNKFQMFIYKVTVVYSNILLVSGIKSPSD